MLRWVAMKPPLIGVSTSVTVDRYPERAYVNAAYLGAVQQAGGIPVLLPPQLEPSARAELLKRLSGVLLTGGGDVDPAWFGEAPHSTTVDVSAARDGLEIELTRWAIETRDSPARDLPRPPGAQRRRSVAASIRTFRASRARRSITARPRSRAGPGARRCIR